MTAKSNQLCAGRAVHVSEDSGLAVEHARERHACNPQMGRRRGHGQVCQIFAENLAGMGWIVHGHGGFMQV